MPQPQPQSGQQTVKVLKISTSDIFPCLKIPSRVVSQIARNIMPAFLRLEVNATVPPYERGWDYVETRNGRLVMVRNKKDGFRLHRGGWKKTKSREKEVIIVREEDIPVIRDHHRAQPRGERLFIDVTQERHERRESPSSNDRQPASPARPRIQVRRPVNAPPSPRFEIRDSRHARFRRCYVDEEDGRLVKKVPIDRVHLERIRPIEVVEEYTYPDEDEYEYGEFYEPVDLSTRESRPYHISEPENSVWDEDLQAWVVRRTPRVRFE